MMMKGVTNTSIISHAHAHVHACYNTSTCHSTDVELLVMVVTLKTMQTGKGRQVYRYHTSFPASIPHVSMFFLVLGEATSSNRLAVSAGKYTGR